MMPGRPIRRKMQSSITAKGGMEWLMVEISNGRTLSSIARELGVSRPLVYDWIHADPERDAAYKAARSIAAHAIMEQALEIVDNASTESTAHVQKAKLQSDFRKYLAATFNPEEFGQKHEKLTVNIGELHLQALKARSNDTMYRALPAEVVVENPEVEK